MFKIKFRIVDDFKALSFLTEEEFDKEYNQILGYIQICFGKHIEGSYYHENPLRNGEEGDELLDYWFDKLLQTIIMLEQGYGYVAFAEIEMMNRWLEFKKIGNEVLLNVAIGKAQNNSLLITEKGFFSHVTPLDFKIEYSEFKTQVREIANEFLMELGTINPCLCNTKIGNMLKQKLRKINLEIPYETGGIKPSNL